MYRNKRLLDEARHHPCQYCGVDDGTIVAAHSNEVRHGKGRGIKAHDIFIAYLCMACHDLVDGRSLPNIDPKYRLMVWDTAHIRTMEILWGMGLVDAEAEKIRRFFDGAATHV